MKRTPAIVTLVVLVALVLVAGFMYLRRNYFPKYRWHAGYSKSSDQPYGLSVIYGFFKEQEGGMTRVFNHAYARLDSTTTTSNFVFMGNEIYSDSSAAAALLAFVARGNRALIATDITPAAFITPFVPRGDSISPYHLIQYRSARLRFTDDVRYPFPMRFNYQELKDTAKLYSWGGYRKAYFSDTLSQYGFRPLAFINDSLVTAFTIDHGKGKLIFHANPITFTNYHMARERGFHHAANVIGELHRGHTYWDDPSVTSTDDVRRARANPIEFIFSHPRLVWAWYVFLLTILLYLVFRSKREQRIIPIVQRLENASIAHVKTVGTLYFKQGGQRQIAGELHMLFMADLRARYHIYSDLTPMEFVAQVAARSGVEPEFVKNLFRELEYARKSENATAAELMNLHGMLETFNKRRK
jgi:hypothetical protein